MNAETWNAIVADFSLYDVPHNRLPFDDLFTVMTAPIVGVVDPRAFGPRAIVASKLFTEWAPPAYGVWTLGHEAGHIVNEHWRTGKGGPEHDRRSLANEIEADCWGIEALRALGYDVNEGPACLGALLRDWFHGDSASPGAIEILQRILAMAQYIEHGDVDRALASVGAVRPPVVIPWDVPDRVLQANIPDIVVGRGGTMIQTPAGIRFYRLVALRAALILECKGIKVRRGFSAYATIKREFGLTGSRAKVLAAFTAIVDEVSATMQRETVE